MQSKIISSPSPLSALPLALEQALYILSIGQNTSHDIIKIRRKIKSIASQYVCKDIFKLWLQTLKTYGQKLYVDAILSFTAKIILRSDRVRI